CRRSCAASRWDATPGAALEPDPDRSGMVHPQHRLLQEVILVERPERLDPHVALLACSARIEQHEDEAGLLHDLTVRLAELPLAGEQREPVGEAGRDRDVEELLEFRDAHLRKVGALAAEEELGANELVPGKPPPGIPLRDGGRFRRGRALGTDAHGGRLERRPCWPAWPR